MSDPEKTPWISRVEEADAEAERCYVLALESGARMGDGFTPEEVAGTALIAIAAELRAARISRRPGAGQTGALPTDYWKKGR